MDHSIAMTSSNTKSKTDSKYTNVSESQPFLESSAPTGTKRTISWTHVKAKVPTQGGGWKEVIRDVSGVALPGEVMALMGGSGAGKTTLMNILANLSGRGVRHTGQVLINGEEMDANEMKRISAYVQQVDLFCGSITVKEQLKYTSLLRLDKKITKAEKKRIVENALKDMNLTESQNTLIGIPGRIKGISVGEKKRLAFACEILSDPDILFCDEPTSGLDSFMAAQVVDALLKLAKKGKTIITVLHQPSSTVFKMFHKVCFMATGKTAYHGSVNDLIEFFKDMGPGMMVPESYNPADHVISKLAVTPDSESEDLKRISMIISMYEKSETAAEMKKLLVKATKIVKPSEREINRRKNRSQYEASYLTQLGVLLIRCTKTSFRDPVLIRVRFIQIVIIALVVGAVNYQVILSGKTVKNLEGLFFNCARDMTFLFYPPSLSVITLELPIMLREHKANIYSVGAWFMAKGLSEMPQYTVLAAIYSTIIYFMAGLAPVVSQFTVFLVTNILLAYVALSVAYFGATVFGNEALAITYMPLITVPLLVFGGFYVQQENIPIYFLPFSYISFFKHGFDALQANQWAGMKSIPGCNAAAGDYCTAFSGDEVLTNRGNPHTYWLSMVILLITIIVCRTIGYIVLRLRVRFIK